MSLKGACADGVDPHGKRRNAVTREQFDFASIEIALCELRAGGMIVVVDDEDRENEGDLMMAAEMITVEDLASYRFETDNGALKDADLTSSLRFHHSSLST